ncbi:MAG: inositol monophosphatase [Candidatus Andersenbacteria bacterium]
MKAKPFPDCSYLHGLAKQAGRVMRTHFDSDLTSTWKEDETPVTIADHAINSLVRSQLSRDFPGITLVGEEGGHHIQDSEYRIFEDSIDGTIPYVASLPVSTFCISVLKGNEPIAAVIHDPFLKRTWMAGRGEGAFLRSKEVSRQLHVSDKTSLKRSHVSLIGWKGSQYNLPEVTARVQQAGAKWSNLCSIAICGGLIARGTMEASVFPAIRGWETAAMQLLVEEAGGKATDIHGRLLTYGQNAEIEGHIISNGHLHDELVQIVAECQ